MKKSDANMTSREAQHAAFNKWYDSIYTGIAYTLKDDMESAWQAGREALLEEIKAGEGVWKYTQEHFDSMGGFSSGYSPYKLESPHITNWIRFVRLPEGEQHE